MRITVLGAAGEVTGSGYLVEAGRSRILVDFGMFQGLGATPEKNADLGPVDPAHLDAVVLTHAHLDHVGRLPLLRGLRCSIHATRATCDLAGIILGDSAGIQEHETERENRQRQREGQPPLTPLYTRQDVDGLMPQFRGMGYDEWMEVAPGVRVRMQDAGHILGSASVEMRVREGGSEKTIMFSGDLGHGGMPTMNPAVPCPAADLVILESTYGDRDHRAPAATLAELKEVLRACSWARQKVICPAFAVGRSQQILQTLAEIVRDGKTPEVPIYLDSPLAIRATEVYEHHAAELESHTRALMQSGQMRRDLRNVHAVLTPEESRKLNDLWSACIIIAGSGMCSGGRIMHHLRHNLWKHGVQVLLTSYMGQGTLGRQLLEGAKRVRIFREDIIVRAKIHTIGGLSAHGGQNELLDWVRKGAEARARVVLTHGEEPQRQALAAKLKERYGIDPTRPSRYEVIEL